MDIPIRRKKKRWGVIEDSDEDSGLLKVCIMTPPKHTGLGDHQLLDVKHIVILWLVFSEEPATFYFSK